MNDPVKNETPDSTVTQEDYAKTLVNALKGFDDSANVQGFGWAIKQMQNGSRVTRNGWNGKNMYIFLIKDWTYTDGKQDNFTNMPFIAMKTAWDTIIPWLASQSDVLCIDWMISL